MRRSAGPLPACRPTCSPEFGRLTPFKGCRAPAFLAGPLPYQVILGITPLSRPVGYPLLEIHRTNYGAHIEPDPVLVPGQLPEVVVPPDDRGYCLRSVADPSVGLVLFGRHVALLPGADLLLHRDRDADLLSRLVRLSGAMIAMLSGDHDGAAARLLAEGAA